MSSYTNQSSPGFNLSTGPLYLLIGADQGDVACQDIFDTISVTLHPNPLSSKGAFNFSYDEFTPVGANGEMAVTKDCEKGSLGGSYSDVTVAAVMDYAACVDDLCTWDWQSVPVEQSTWDMEYRIISTYKIFVVNKAIVSQLNNVSFYEMFRRAGNIGWGIAFCVCAGLSGVFYMVSRVVVDDGSQAGQGQVQLADM